MLPSSLISVYQQYKQDTDAVASWLATTAKACGYSADLFTHVGPVKRKKHNKKDKYIVAIKDFIPLAQFIVASKKPAVAVPESLVDTINRVIRVRSSFGSHLKDHGLEPSEEGDNKHSFFVRVLEQVRDALRPRMSALAAERQPVLAALATPSSSRPTLVNQFEALKIYEPSSEFLDAPDIQRPQPTALPSEKVVYEAEASARTDLEDAIFTFALMIDDMNKIRQEVKRIWAGYRDGMFDLAAAAVATNTAVDLARSLADEIEPLFRPHGGVWKVAQKFYLGVAFAAGFSPPSMSFDFTSREFAFNPETYDLADYTFFATYYLLEGLKAILQPGHLPLYIPRGLGTYNPKSDRARMTATQRYNEDKILVIETCVDLMTIIRAFLEWPVEDELLRGMKEMDDTKKVSLSLAFAMQTYLDIHHLLRDQVGRGMQEVVHQTSIMRTNLQAHIDFHKNLKIRTWPIANEKVLAHTEIMIGWLGEDPIHQIKDREYRKNGLSLPDTQRHYLLKQSPVMAGLVLYHYRTLVYGIGLAVANA